MKIAAGSIVKIEYEIRVKGGDVIESSTKSGPVQYVQGEGRLLPALEKRLEGLATGESLEGEIPAVEAIPPEETLPTRVIARKEFGDQALFEAHNANGATIDLRIIALDDEKVTARLMPPLAGKDLAFKVRVIRIEDPVSHIVSVVQKPPPPLPAAAINLELEPDPD